MAGRGRPVFYSNEFHRKKRAKAREKYTRRREAGLCYHCDELAVEGRTHCQRHLDYARESNRLSRLRKATRSESRT